jgi:hypothetical protein
MTAICRSVEAAFGSLLLYNEQRYHADPIVCAVHMKKLYTSMHLLVKRNHCGKYSCHICGHLKMIAPSLDLQLGYMKLCPLPP